MNCGMECVKYLLFIFNFIFALGGLAILVCGVMIRVALGNVNAEAQADVTLPATLLIAVGAIIFIIAFFGCCGAIRESHCMVVTFAVLLLTLLVIQVAVASYGFVKLKGQDVEEKINRELQRSVNEYFSGKDHTSIDAIQKVAQCCGYNSYNDYLNNPSNNKPGLLPASCCKALDTETCQPRDSYSDGCGNKFFKLLKTYATALGGLALGIAAVELIGIIFSFCLANSIRNVERRGYKV